ncbi:ATP-binding cassette, subfamily G (WHITE), member 2 [Mytilus galloprovincialis]|uniref:ATP-binding cassette, subfamily G (WHITE), member 2 n=1 Tax=Mytilus galloprovincialis TaxID=29158 RepID=A0A8B6DUN2_MYTGA|nr:ATP-binding cassette, subfamily G (WHITE), member 2 [Mytilus galloprovincialis]
MSDSEDDAAFASADEGEETKQSPPKGDKSIKPDTDKATKSVGKGDKPKQASKTNLKSEKEATDKTKNPEVPQQKGATGKGKKKGKQAKKNNKSTEKHETKETESKKPESEVVVKEEEKTESKTSDIENQGGKTPDTTQVEEKKEPENDKEEPTDSSNVSEKTESIVKSPSGQNIQREGSGEGSEKPDIKSVLDQLADDDDDDEEEEEEEDQKSSSWNIGGWGSSIMNVAQTSVSTFTNQVGEGFSTIMDTMENTLGAIPPEQLAYMKTDKKEDEALESHDVAHTMKPAESSSKEITEQPKHVEPGMGTKEEKGSDDKKAEKAEEAKEDTASGGGGGWFSSWGMSSLKDAVAKTSNIVQSTSKNLVTGSMDVLETVGKKAFDFIEDHDPGIHRSKVLLERGDKPNLSSVLKEAKEESEYKQEMEKESEEARKSHFGYLFDEFQGISHLEALEILSNQCEKKVQILLTSLPAETLSSIKSQLIEIKQIFEHENDDDDDDEEQEHEFIKVMTELLTDLHLGTTPNKINKVQENIRKEITDFYEKQEKGETIEPKYFTDIEEVHTKLVSSFQKSTLNSRLQSQMNPILQQYQHAVETNTVKVLPKIEYATSAFTQFRAVSGRTILNLLRNPQLSVMQWLVLIIFGLIVGAIYWQLEKDCVTGIQNRVGAFFFIIMNQVFGNLSAVELFIKERSIFMHENVSGFYRVSAYFFSKIICDVIPMRLIPVILFSTVTYFMLGLRLAAENFFLYVLSLFLVAMSASGIAFFFSATVSIFAVANLCIALTYVFMMVHEQRMFYQKAKVVVNDEKICKVCKKRLGNSAFVRYPNGVIVHYYCCKDPNKCPED